MENKTDANSANIPAEIKQEPVENQTTSNESVDKITNEPSSIRIIDSFSVLIDFTKTTINSEIEEENTTQPNACGETDSNSPPNTVETSIKKEPGSEETTSDSRKSVASCDNVKKENVTITVKTENDDASIKQNFSNNTITLPLDDFDQINPPPDGKVIAKILTTSMSSTSPSCSSSNCYQTDDVSSSTDPQKPPCRYGKSCYRLNENHRKNFSHPPGSDPLKSPEKPRCKYGIHCYRKNEEHRKRFIHERSPDNAMSKTRKRKVRNPASQTTGHVYESDSDDDSYLYEEYDGTSDEFHPDDDDDDDTDSDETDFDDDTDKQILLNTS